MTWQEYIDKLFSLCSQWFAEGEVCKWNKQNRATAKDIHWISCPHYITDRKTDVFSYYFKGQKNVQDSFGPFVSLTFLCFLFFLIKKNNKWLSRVLLKLVLCAVAGKITYSISKHCDSYKISNFKCYPFFPLWRNFILCVFTLFAKSMVT